MLVRASGQFLEIVLPPQNARRTETRESEPDMLKHHAYTPGPSGASVCEYMPACTDASLVPMRCFYGCAYTYALIVLQPAFQGPEDNPCAKASALCRSHCLGLADMGLSCVTYGGIVEKKMETTKWLG